MQNVNYYKYVFKKLNVCYVRYRDANEARESEVRSGHMRLGRGEVYNYQDHVPIFRLKLEWQIIHLTIFATSHRNVPIPSHNSVSEIDHTIQ